MLTFGHAPNPNDGEKLAARVNDRLRGLLPDMFGTDTIMESLHFIGGPTGAVDFQVFFFASRCAS